MAVKVLLVVLCLMCMMTTVAAEENQNPVANSKDAVDNQPPAIDKGEGEARGPVVRAIYVQLNQEFALEFKSFNLVSSNA